MSTQDSRGGATGLRDRRVARVLDREISPVWHDRFARLIVRNLPALPEILALEVHCGTGRGTSELLHRLGAGAKILAIDPDEGALELAKTRIRPEWKNRVYFKGGHFDDVTAMADDSYNLVVANLVLGESVDLGPAIGEMIRVCKIGGRILATVPLHGTWDEVEDIFAEILRDAGMTAALRRLEALRAIRPTGPQLGKLLRKLGCVEDDYVIEHERFQLLFPSGREFLFAPVIEHGPLQMWKAVIGKDGAPQELFWRLKEAIDTYYAGHVLAVTVHAGLVHVEVAKGTTRPGPRLAARFWRHYPELDKLWGGLAVGYARVSDPILPFSDADIGDFDLDIDVDESDPRRRTGAVRALRPPTGKLPVVETPSPEDFGLRFRPRDESSGINPLLDSESSGARPKPPGSEASGLRTLSQLRDSEISATRPATSFRPVPLPIDEDDFSELNKPDTRPHPVVAARDRQPERPPVDEDLSRLAESEDDFSELNDALKLPPRNSESSGRRPIPDMRGDAESSSRRALAELRAEAAAIRPPVAEPEPRTPTAPAPPAKPARTLADLAGPPAAADLAEQPAAEQPPPPASSILIDLSDEPGPAAAEPAAVTSAPAPAPRKPEAPAARPSLRLPERKPEPRKSAPDLSAKPAPAAEPKPATDLAAKPATAAEPKPAPDLAAKPAPAPEPAADLSEKPAPADEPAEDTSASGAAEARPQPLIPARRPEPTEAPKPSLPSFRLPEPRPVGKVDASFRPPSFKPPGKSEESGSVPIRQMFRPPPKPAVDEEEEPEEIDELEPVEEIEEEPPAPVATAPKPPPPRAPPPPRPPAPSPDKKK